MVRVGRWERAEVVVGAALLGGSGAAASVAVDRVAGWEERPFRALNGLPDVLWPVLWVPMQTGSMLGAVVVPAATAVLSRDVRLTLSVALAGQAAYWGAKAVKVLVGRERPGLLLDDVTVREHADDLGYLSAHTAVATAMAAALVPSLPRRWRPVAVAIPALTAVARLEAGLHLPLDVVGGAGLGLLLGGLARVACGIGGRPGPR